MYQKTLKRLFFLSIILGGLSFLSSCKKDVTKIASTGWNPNLAVPVGEANFEISTLLENIDSSIVVGSSGEISIAFEETLDSISSSDVIVLDDYSQSFDLTPSGLATTPIFTSGSTYSATSPISTAYTSPNGVEINAVNFKSGQINFTVTSDFQHDIDLIITIDDIFINGSALSETVAMVYTGSLPVVKNVSVDLAGATADFTSGNTQINTLSGSIDATFTASGTPGNPILGTESLTMDLDLVNLEYENITGYFGQETLTTISDSVLFKLFQNSEMSGNIAFSNPSLTFNIQNSFGIPVDLNLSNFKTIDSTSGESTDMILATNIINLNTPSVIGNSALTSFTINKDNTTNIETLIGTKPRYLKFDFSASTNPLGNTGTLNFLESDSKIVVNAALDLPFEGSASGIAAGDTLDFSFENDVDIVESVMFRLNVDNGFPVSFKGQGKFVDENYNTVFTLFTTPTEVVKAAPVNNTTGKVNGTSSKITDISIDENKIQLLNQVKHIIIEGTVDTTDPSNTNVKFYDSYSISLKLGMQVKLQN